MIIKNHNQFHIPSQEIDSKYADLSFHRWINWNNAIHLKSNSLWKHIHYISDQMHENFILWPDWKYHFIYWEWMNYEDIWVTIDKNKKRDIDYHLWEKLRYENNDPKLLSKNDIIKLLKNKNIAIYTWAWISRWKIYDMNELESKTWINKEFIKNNFENLIQNKAVILDIWNYFINSFYHSNPNEWHHHIAKICKEKHIILFTENYDKLHQKTWINPIKNINKSIDNQDNQEYFRNLDFIITVGLRQDDRWFLWLYKKLNPNGKIISLNLDKSEYLSDNDYLLKWDLHETLLYISNNL